MTMIRHLRVCEKDNRYIKLLQNHILDPVLLKEVSIIG